MKWATLKTYPVIEGREPQHPRVETVCTWTAGHEGRLSIEGRRWNTLAEPVAVRRWGKRHGINVTREVTELIAAIAAHKTAWAAWWETVK